MNEAQEYKMRWRGREAGPFSVEEINRRLDDHEIGMTHEVYCDNQWMTVEEFLNVLANPPAPEIEQPPIPALAPPAAPQNTSPLRITLSRNEEASPHGAMGEARPRHRLLFALLAIVAGFIGAHNFYARQWLTGLLQLLLSVATCLMGFGIIAAWLWAIAEAVFVRKDGNGIDMI